MAQVADLLWHSGDSPDLADSFWVHTQAAWFTAHAGSVVEPLLRGGFDVLVDGWVYKFFAKLRGQGYSQSDLDLRFGRIRMPDAVLMLTADIGALYDRREGQFRPAELGMHAGYRRLGRDTFIAYQRRGLDRLTEYAAQPHWATVELDARGSVAESVVRVAPVLAGLRTARAGAGAVSR